MDVLDALFGQGKDLTALQMGARAVVVFYLTLVVMRVSGRRSFGQRTTFDQVVMVLIGAVISRAVVGASPFVPTIAAALVIVCLHRVTAWLSISIPALDAMLNGDERLLVAGGRRSREEMRRGLISDRDLLEAARQHGQTGIADCDLVLERGGQISVVKRRADRREDSLSSPS